MTTYTEGNYLSDLLKYEVSPLWCRDAVIVASGQNLAQFAVVGRVAASGKIAEYNPAATDGTQTPVGALLEAVNASSADVAGAPMLARGAVVDQDFLVWKSGLNDTQKTAGRLALQALGIVPRVAP
jgi:hypothetical protein